MFVKCKARHLIPSPFNLFNHKREEACVTFTTLKYLQVRANRSEVVFGNLNRAREHEQMNCYLNRNHIRNGWDVLGELYP